MRALVIDETAKAEVSRVTDFAIKPENFYIVGPQGFTLQRPPGDDPRHVAHLVHGFRCVFSITKADGKLWKHLSISVMGNKYPNPVAAFTIADLFGFKGYDGKGFDPPQGWQVNVSGKDRCVILVQEHS